MTCPWHDAPLPVLALAYARSKGDTYVLRSLAAALERRGSRKARRLLEKVRAALEAAAG